MHFKEDVLDRENFVKHIIDLITVVSDNRKSCCFAIEGEWGSGKSFVLEKIQERLQAEQSEATGSDRFFVARYDCWEYDYYEEPVVAIISVLGDTIDRYVNLISEEAKTRLLKTAKNTITKAIAKIVESKTGINVEEYIGDTEDEKKLYDQYFGFNDAVEKVRAALKEIAEDQTVVIIVDELDRCLPSYAIKVLERIHHIFYELENIVVIIAMEKKQIENSLHQIYGKEMDIEQYLKKFISFSVKLDNGSARNFLTKYASFKNMFNIQQKDEMEAFLANITSGMDIRTQEKLFEKAESMHRLVVTEEKMNSEIFAFEILTLCVKEKAAIDMRWIFQPLDYFGIGQEIGTEYYHIIRTYVENIKNNSTRVGNGNYFCRNEKFTDKLIFIISGLYNEYEYGFCGDYYCNDETIGEEINFAKKIYNLLTI